MIFYDTHAHLDYPELRAELEQVLERARAAGITRIISIGTDLDSSRRAIAIAEQHEMVYAVAGWHPSNAMEAPEDIRHELSALAQHPKVIALGETGMDFYRLPSKAENGTVEMDVIYKEKQGRLFQQHLEVAAAAKLNCVIHQRVAMPETIKLLAPYSDRVRGVFHCFVDEFSVAQQVLEMNSIISFTGILTFKNAEIVKKTFQQVPFGKFMFETDCPYLAPAPHRGKRCEPSYVTYIAGTAALIKNCSLDELSRATCKTAHEFFPKLL